MYEDVHVSSLLESISFRAWRMMKPEWEMSWDLQDIVINAIIVDSHKYENGKWKNK